MTAPQVLRTIPVDDRAWLIAALGDALQGGAPILPLAPGIDPDDPAVEALRALPLPEGTAVVVRTSGSSGIPKSVALSRAALVESAEATAEALGGAGQWLVTLPANLISGLQMLVRSAVSGIDPVFAPEGAGARELLETAQLMEHERRYISLVPVQLARLVELAEVDEDAAEIMRRFDGVLVGGQALTLDLRRRAHALRISVRRSYGMTETSGGCVYDGVETGDTLVRIRQGEVQLAGPTLALGYVGDEALTAEKFIVEADRQGNPIRWYRTGDAGELLGGMLTVTGRLDRVLISGGVNVSLDEIERVAREFAGWGSAVAMPMEHPEWGSRPYLVVETAEGAVPFDEVRNGIRAKLGAAATPEWANETVELPRLAGGKPDFQAIAAWTATLKQSFAQLRDTNQGAEPTDETDEGHSA